MRSNYTDSPALTQGSPLVLFSGGLPFCLATALRTTSWCLRRSRTGFDGEYLAFHRRREIERIDGQHLDRTRLGRLCWGEHQCRNTAIDGERQSLDQFFIRYDFIIAGRQNPANALKREGIVEYDGFVGCSHAHRI